MTKTKIQIFSITSVEDAESVLSLGADHIGFIVGRVRAGRIITKKQAKEIVETTNSKGIRVMVPLTASFDEILSLTDYVGPEIVHISPYYADFPVSFIKELREKLHEKNVSLMCAIFVEDERSVEVALEIKDSVDYIKLDTKTFTGIGFSGKFHSWETSKEIVKKAHVPVFLAGGLSIENVCKAIEIVNPYGVDATSSLDLHPETGKKDLAKVKRFIENVRGCERM